MTIQEYLKEKRLLTDGAMGTYFDKHDMEDFDYSEEANIVCPEVILDIHKEYIKSGAHLIRSNTFLANQKTLSELKKKNKEIYQNITIKEFVQSGYRVAMDAQKWAESQGITVFAAADIGPISEEGEIEQEVLIQEYYEICDAFLEAGCETFVFETFPEETFVLKMAEYVRRKKKTVWIMGQFTFLPTGYSSTGRHFTTVLNKAIQSGLLDAAGFNCGVGAVHMCSFYKKYIELYGAPGDVVLTALPNCGYPNIVRGKAVYSDSVPYFSNKLKEVAMLNVRILGGCCGTTPEYIAAISKWIDSAELSIPTKVMVTSVKTDGSKAVQKVKRQNPFMDKLMSGEKVYAVELDPPFDTDETKLLKGVRELQDSKADIITLADSPLARARADSLLMAAKLKRETGMQVMPHISCRDRNRISIRGGFLGGFLSHIHNYLIVTGDPVPRSERDITKSVFDFNSIRCMHYVKNMNEELFREDPICYGGALNHNGSNIDAVAERMKRKIQEGCSYFLTQPVYSEEDIEKLNELRNKTDAKILIGIMPLVSYRNAIFIKNEMPGIYVPDNVVALYKENMDRKQWEEVATELSVELMKKSSDVGAGYYLMTPFHRAGLVKEIMKKA